MSASDDVLDDMLRVFATTLGPEERALLQRVRSRMDEVVETLVEQVRPPSTAAARDRGIASAREVMAAAIADLDGPIEAGQSVMVDQISDGFANAIDGVLSEPIVRLSVDQMRAAADGPFFGWGTRDWTRWHEATSAARIDRELRAAYFAGEGIGSIARRMEKIGLGTRQEMIVTARTALVSAGNQAARQLYLNNSDIIKRAMVVATLDNATCRQCGGLDGKIIDPSDAGSVPTFHPQCRCFLSPVIAGVKPKRVGFDWWIGRQSVETQNKSLGKGPAELYRAGKIKADDFVTSTGRMRTVAELRAVAN